MSEANQLSLPVGETARRAIVRSQLTKKVRHSVIFCRRMDANSRKQGMKGGSVLAHVTDWNDEADEESAPKGEQKRALPRTPPKGSSPFGILQIWAFCVD